MVDCSEYDSGSSAEKKFRLSREFRCNDDVSVGSEFVYDERAQKAHDDLIAWINREIAPKKEKVQPVRHSFLDYAKKIKVFEAEKSGRWGWDHGQMIVGSGRVTSPRCGEFSGKLMGCSDHEAHFRLTGKRTGYFRRVHYHCDNPRCPVCYPNWAFREAQNAEARLKVASKLFGDAEHIITSFPESMYKLPVKELRRRAIEANRVRGVIGGFMVVHGYRYESEKDVAKKGLNRRPRYWYWSPHMHSLSFVLGGYKCRGCPKMRMKGKGNCGDCHGFRALCEKFYSSDDLIVKIKGKRKSVLNTLWYELSHCTVSAFSRGSHACVWYGCVSNRCGLGKGVVEKKKCPICGGDLHKHKYVGDKPQVTIRGKEGYEGEFDVDVFEGGRLVYLDLEVSDVMPEEGSGSYEG